MLPWRILQSPALLAAILSGALVSAAPSQRWNLEYSSLSDLDPRALSPDNGTASENNKRALTTEAIITEWTAMGDSYASGVGAGQVEGSEKPCRRYSDAYGRLMDRDTRLGAAANGHKFNNVYCSGSRFKNIHSGGENSQVDQMGDPQVATLTIGGNEVGYVDILLACIYKPYPFGGNGDCDGTIKTSGEKIASEDFRQGLAKAIGDALDHANKPEFRLYVTGYAAFFNEDTTQCNDVSVTAWYFQGGKWTQDLRRQINSVITQLNDRIRGIVQEFDPAKVVYVDVNSKFNTHRFCEPSITEPDLYNEDVWFFHYYKERHDETLSDGAPLGTAPQGGPATAQPWDGIDAGSCDPDAADWGDKFNCQMAKAHAEHPELQLNTDIQIASQNNGLSPEQARVFHPKSGGQAAWAQAIFDAGFQTDWKSGWCTIHVVQFQKPDPTKDNYKFDVTIFDASNPPINIGHVEALEIPTGQNGDVKSRLPYDVVLTTGEHDEDAVLFAYGGVKWGSNDQEHKSNFGGYEDGKREGDTGFSC